jgi:hypothetical protein
MGEFGKLRSWHAVRTFTRVPGRAIALCGRWLTGPFVTALPLNDKTCETCLRLLERVRETER